MEYVTWLLEKKSGCELEMKGDTGSVVLNSLTCCS